MPLYEYACESCGKQFERIRKFSDPPLETCPLCGSGPVHKLVSSPAFQFKGSGFYITDYGRKGEPTTGGETKTGGEAKTSSETNAGGETKETKEAKKTSDSTESSKPAPSAPPSTSKPEK